MPFIYNKIHTSLSSSESKGNLRPKLTLYEWLWWTEVAPDLETYVDEVMREEIALQSQSLTNEEPKVYATQHSEEVGLSRYNVLNARATNMWLLTLRRKFSVITVKQMDMSFQNVRPQGILSTQTQGLNILFKLSSIELLKMLLHQIPLAWT